MVELLPPDRAVLDAASRSSLANIQQRSSLPLLSQLCATDETVKSQFSMRLIHFVLLLVTFVVAVSA
jgi:hypothetical protein